MTLFKKGSSSLGNELKRAISSISVDVLGYEKAITKTMIKRIDYHSKKLKIPAERLQLKIYLKSNQNTDTVKAFLYDNNKAVLVITPEELVRFFINEGTSYLINNDKISNSIKQYFYEFARENKLYKESISINIYEKEKSESIEVQAFNNQEFVKLISLTSLIKYFKK